jgi:glutathione synthase/RimK-type ligase-like ATP-grasp enzyme
MRLCFVVESRYRNDSMPLHVAQRLTEWGHDITVIEPALDPLDVTTFTAERFDAVVLKTVADGPGLTLLELVAASGGTTINDVAGIRRARDKAVAIGLALRHGLPVPATWFAPTIEQFAALNQSEFPLVVKPANGSSGEDVHVAYSRADLGGLAERYPAGEARFWLGQRYVPNPGVDLKLYATGEGVYAELRTSPLVDKATDADRLVPVPADLVALVERVGLIFGLDIFGIDLVQGADGWVIVDVNDFPSFRLVPDAAGRVAGAILRLAAARRIESIREVLR